MAKKALVVICLALAVSLVTVVGLYDNLSAKKKVRPTIMIQSRIDNGPWLKQAVIYPLKEQTIKLKVKKRPRADIRWYQIIPDLSKVYKNANLPWEKDPYKWVGFDTIKYHRKELTSFRGQWTIQPFEVTPGSWRNSISALPFLKKLRSKSQYYNDQLGSFWYQAVVKQRGKTFRSYGIEDGDKRGLSPNVFRISVRGSEGYLGYLTSFFNVPGLFGSIPYQSHNYIGVDCADVLVAAYCKWKHRSMRKNHCVASLVGGLPKAVKLDIKDGKPNKRIVWDKQIKSGYLIAVKYEGERSYQHIGSLAGDTNRNGILDKDDLVLHCGPYPLHYSRLNEGKFDGHVVVLKPFMSKLAEDHWLIRVAQDIRCHLR